MLEAALDSGVKVILLTPTLDTTQAPTYAQEDKTVLAAHAAQIRHLAATYEVGLVDSFAAFHAYLAQGDLSDLLSWSNHPNHEGHQLVTRELLRWFPPG
jgi:acyl-CoA thioesterase I